MICLMLASQLVCATPQRDESQMGYYGPRNEEQAYVRSPVEAKAERERIALMKKKGKG